MAEGSVWDWSKTTQGLGDVRKPDEREDPPVGSRGGAPVGEREDEVPQKLKNFYSIVTSNFYAFSGSISHIFTYICLFFPCLQHHSTKSAKWGAF